MKEIIFKIFIATTIFFSISSTYATNDNRIGLILVHNDGLTIKTFKRPDSLSSFFDKDVKLKLDEGLNNKLYMDIKKSFTGVKILHINNISEEEKTILSDEDRYHSKRKEIIINIAKRNNISKLVLLAEEYIYKKIPYTAYTQFGSFAKTSNINIKGQGFYILAGSDINHKIKKKRALYAYMSTRGYVYDGNTGEKFIGKNFSYTKQVALKKVFDKNFRDNIYKNAIDGVSSDTRKKQYHDLVYADPFDKNKLIEFYKKNVADIIDDDEGDDDPDTYIALFKEKLHDEYAYSNEFTDLPDSVKTKMKEHLEIARKTLIEHAAKHLKKHL